MELSKDAAECVAMQLQGAMTTPPPYPPDAPSQAEMEALTEKLSKAEAHAKACEEQVADYEGEIEYLQEELKKARFSVGGVLPGTRSNPFSGLGGSAVTVEVPHVNKEVFGVMAGRIRALGN